MFAHNVISFRRGLMNSSTADMFRRFLHDEVIKGNHSTYKKVIGTKMVNVTKLLNDLSFWAEVERYNINNYSNYYVDLHLLYASCNLMISHTKN